ncbi:hypothetical protein [Paenibacillus mendelii]|uniref:Uncharacterized protein n=1 Tax=Paenibacillus mendelii TaxID=206163 RepID=A0ABV6JC17_9BACL|nr:hypothetical protein [Paenibacillus mendelii]
MRMMSGRSQGRHHGTYVITANPRNRVYDRRFLESAAVHKVGVSRLS